MRIVIRVAIVVVAMALILGGKRPLSAAGVVGNGHAGKLH